MKELLHRNNGGGKLLAMGKNPMSRCALHIATLRENLEVIGFIAKAYPETLRIGDNVSTIDLRYYCEFCHHALMNTDFSKQLFYIV